MLDDILEIIVDVILGFLFKRTENGFEWNFFSIFAAVVMVCLMVFLGYRAIGYYVFVLLAIVAAVMLLAFFFDKRKSKEE